MPPSSVSRFPVDLANSQLGLSGIYADGWIGVDASLSLYEPGGGQYLVVRGMVPRISRDDFQTRLEVRLDQDALTNKRLGIGDFTISERIGSHPGVHRISLIFSGGQELPGADGRIIGARLSFVGFDHQQATQASAGDIVDPESGIRLGSGWDVLETFQNETFRWVTNDAHILLSPQENSVRKLSMVIEPGPGLNGGPFLLRVLNPSGKQVDAVEVRHRQQVQLSLPLEDRHENDYRLHVNRDGKRASGKDPRILNFRVFRIKSN